MVVIGKPDFDNGTSLAIGGQYKDYEDVPMTAGNLNPLREIRNLAYSQSQEIAIIGDSQETGTSGSGLVYWQTLNKLSKREFGGLSKLPWQSFAIHLSANMFCTGTSAAGTNILTSQELPNFRTNETFSGNLGPLQTLYPDGGDIAELADGAYFQPDTGSVQWECLIERRNDVNAAVEMRVTQITNTIARDYFGAGGSMTVQNQFNTTGLNLNSDNTSFAYFNIGNVVYNPAEPFVSVYLTGLNSSGNPIANEALLNVIAGRFVDTAINRGITWTSFSTGGETTSAFITKYPKMQAALSVMPAFNAVFISLGANDGGSALNIPSEFKNRLLTLLSNIRTRFGANQYCVITSEPPKDSYGPGNEQLVANFRKYAAVQAEVARQDGNCGFLNLGRALLEIDANFTTNYLADLAHLTSDGQKLQARAIFNLIESL